MKKTAYICLLVFIGSLFGCVDKFEEVNTNGNKMYEAELPNIFAGTVYRTMNTVAEFNFMNGNLFARYLVLGFRTTPSQDEIANYNMKGKKVLKTVWQLPKRGKRMYIMSWFPCTEVFP